MDNFSNRLALRISALVVAVLIMGFMVLFFALAGQAAGVPNSAHTAADWAPIFAETFEGDFPGQWMVTNTTQLAGSMWGATTFTASQGTHSAWMIGAPAGLNPLTATYTNNQTIWMVYGPLTLTGYVDAQLSFDVWLDVPQGDWVVAGASDSSAPSSIYSGTLLSPGIMLTGTERAWHSVTVPLKAMAGQPQVWIGFGFMSNGDTQVATGVFVDNVVLSALDKYRTYLPVASRRWPPIPYAPTLNEIVNPGQIGNYTATWSYSGASPVITFTLQEATDAGFLANVVEYYPGSGTSQAISGKAGNTYYYRVRGYNEYGAGEWSNVVSTMVRTYYFDDFSDPQSGWLVKSIPLCTVGYQNGEYRMYVPLDFRGGGNVDTWFVKPVVLAPVQPPSGSSYCASVDTHFASAPGWWELHGLVFGASADLSHVYRLDTNVNGDWAVMEYTSYKYPDGGLNAGEQWLISWRGVHVPPVNPDDGLNHLKVLVEGTSATFYINGVWMGHLDGLNDLPSMNRVGIIGGSYEVTPIDARFDNFTWSTNLNECP